MKTEPQIPWTIEQLQQVYRSGRVTPTGVVRELCNRIDSESTGKDWICVCPKDGVLASAKVCEQRLEEADAFDKYPLLGVPFAVKDNIDVAGLPTTAACPAFGYTASRNAVVVDRLLAAGAILIGKTNLDQFATGLVGVRSPYGAVRNPFDGEYIAGGSSAGSAAATAKGHVVFALGTDTAGSGRVPAGACNLVGLKPTIGLVSNAGSVAACRTLDCISIFAHLVEDAWRVLTVLAEDRAGYEAPNRHLVRPLGPLAGSVRLGIPHRLEFFGDDLAQAAWADSIERIAETSGIECSSFDFAPFEETAALLYDGPWIAERRAAIQTFMDRHAGEMNETVRAIIRKADGISAVESFQGLYRRDALKQQCDLVFERCDALVVPTSPSLYKIAEVDADPIELNTRLGYYTNFVNLLGLSAIALPGCFRADGLPAGVTLIGPGGADHRLAALAQRLEPRLHTRLGTTDARPEPCGATLVPVPTDEARIEVVVVGAHLRGLPLNWQLLERRAKFVCETETAPAYRFFELAGASPRKPGLIRTSSDGVSIDVEVWSMPVAEFGFFVQQVPAPLGIGSIELCDGRVMKGFLCEAVATLGARDISEFGGWRNFLEHSSVSGSTRVPDPA